MPATQSKQTWIDAAPSSILYFPGRHAVHWFSFSARSALLHVPLLQRWQPSREKAPSVSPYLPAGHQRHAAAWLALAIASPPALPNVPLGHSWQLLCRVRALYRPVAQMRHWSWSRW